MTALLARRGSFTSEEQATMLPLTAIASKSKAGTMCLLDVITSDRSNYKCKMIEKLAYTQQKSVKSAHVLLLFFT
jgi:hypothetical protein